MKEIDNILAELSLVSPDGMVSGWTDENVRALTSVLEKRGMNQDEILELISPLLDEAGRKPKVVVDDDEEDAPKGKEDRSGDPYPDKAYSPVKVATEIQRMIEKNKDNPGWQEFLANKDAASTIEQAIEFYNKTDPNVIKQLNDINTGQSRAALGKGEVQLVWFLKGATHGGGSTGDINIGGKSIDAKEVGKMSKSGDGNINIERNSFSGFNQNKFVSELSDLINIVRDDNVRNYIYSNILHTPQAKKDLGGGEKRGPVPMTTTFLESFDMGKFGANTISGINYIGKKVGELKNSPDGGTTVVSVFSKGEKHSAAVNNPDDVIPTIQQMATKQQSDVEEVPLEMKPLNKNDETLAISKLLRAKFFQTAWTEEKMWDSLSQNLHYDGIVVISNGGDKAVEYIDKKDFAKKFAFRGLNKGITISYPKLSSAESANQP